MKVTSEGPASLGTKDTKEKVLNVRVGDGQTLEEVELDTALKVLAGKYDRAWIDNGLRMGNCVSQMDAKAALELLMYRHAILKSETSHAGLGQQILELMQAREKKFELLEIFSAALQAHQNKIDDEALARRTMSDADL